MIKKFDQLNEEDGIYRSTTREFIVNHKKILDKLREGFAVKIQGGSIVDFLDMIDSFGQGIKTIRGIQTYQSLYFVLIGRRLYHTKIPKFNENDLEVYAVE